MATNYSGWTVAKLTKERDKIDKAIEATAGKEKKSLIANIKQLAADGGFDITELLGDSSAAPVRKKRAASKKKVASKAAGKKKVSKKKGGKRGPAAQIYRNPGNHDETWSGRGRPPRWVVDHVAAGGDKEDLRF